MKRWLRRLTGSSHSVDAVDASHSCVMCNMWGIRLTPKSTPPSSYSHVLMYECHGCARWTHAHCAGYQVLEMPVQWFCSAGCFVKSQPTKQPKPASTKRPFLLVATARVVTNALAERLSIWQQLYEYDYDVLCITASGLSANSNVCAAGNIKDYMAYPGRQIVCAGSQKQQHGVLLYLRSDVVVPESGVHCIGCSKSGLQLARIGPLLRLLPGLQRVTIAATYRSTVNWENGKRTQAQEYAELLNVCVSDPLRTIVLGNMRLDWDMPKHMAPFKRVRLLPHGMRYINRRKGCRPDRIHLNETTGKYELCYLNADTARRLSEPETVDSAGWLCTRPEVQTPHSDGDDEGRDREERPREFVLRTDDVCLLGDRLDWLGWGVHTVSHQHCLRAMYCTVVQR